MNEPPPLTPSPPTPHFVGIAVVSFAPYATSLFSWDYAIIIADKSCLLPWLQIDARGALKLAFPLQKSSFHASCSEFSAPPHTHSHPPFVEDFTVFVMFIFHLLPKNLPPRPPHTANCLTRGRSLFPRHARWVSFAALRLVSDAVKLSAAAMRPKQRGPPS